MGEPPRSWLFECGFLEGAGRLTFAAGLGYMGRGGCCPADHEPQQAALLRSQAPQGGWVLVAALGRTRHARLQHTCPGSYCKTTAGTLQGQSKAAHTMHRTGRVRLRSNTRRHHACPSQRRCPCKPGWRRCSRREAYAASSTLRFSRLAIDHAHPGDLTPEKSFCHLFSNKPQAGHIWLSTRLIHAASILQLPLRPAVEEM